MAIARSMKWIFELPGARKPSVWRQFGNLILFAAALVVGLGLAWVGPMMPTVGTGARERESWVTYGLWAVLWIVSIAAYLGLFCLRLFRVGDRFNRRPHYGPWLILICIILLVGPTLARLASGVEMSSGSVVVLFALLALSVPIGLFGNPDTPGKESIAMAERLMDTLSDEGDLVHIACFSTDFVISEKAVLRLKNPDSLALVAEKASSEHIRTRACSNLGHLWDECFCRRCGERRDRHVLSDRHDTCECVRCHLPMHDYDCDCNCRRCRKSRHPGEATCYHCRREGVLSSYVEPVYWTGN